MDITFALVECFLSDGAGNLVTGPVAGISGPYSAGLKASLTSYWRDMSGGRINQSGQRMSNCNLRRTLPQWTVLAGVQKINQASAQAKVAGLLADGVEVLLIANDADLPAKGFTARGSSCYVHATIMSPAVIAHEMGHYFEWRGTGKGGHADVTVPFFRQEYGDPTCIMGGEATKYTFVDGSFPALLSVIQSRNAGPGMNPALIDQCGWIDADAPLVPRIDPQALGSALLKPWEGSARPGG